MKYRHVTRPTGYTTGYTNKVIQLRKVLLISITL